MEKFLILFEEAVDTEVANGMETVLADIEEWDSLAYVTFCVLIDNAYKKQLRSTDLREAVTIKDLYELVQRTDMYED